MPSSPLPDKSAPVRLHRRSHQNALPRASSFTSNTRILHTSSLHITADHAPIISAKDTTTANGGGSGFGGATFIAAADHLESKLHTGNRANGLPNGTTPPSLPLPIRKEAGTKTTEVPKSPTSTTAVAKENNISGPAAPSLGGLNSSSTYVPRHAKLYKTHLKDLSPLVQASHPVVRGVAIYKKSSGEKVEVDVEEYVDKLNEEILRLREENKGLKEKLDEVGSGGVAGKEKEKGLRRVGTFLKKGKGPSEKKVMMNGTGGVTSPSVSQENALGKDTAYVQKPAFEAKPAVSFPTQFGGAGTVAQQSKQQTDARNLPAFTPQPAVNFPAPAFAGTSTIPSARTSTKTATGGRRSSAVKSTPVAKDKKKKNEDAVAAALSAVETFELKKPSVVAATHKNSPPKKVATVKSKDVDKHIKKIEKKVGGKTTFVKPEQKTSSSVLPSEGSSDDTRRGSIKSQGRERSSGAALGANGANRKAGLGSIAGKKFKKSFSFINKGNVGQKIKRVASVSKMEGTGGEKKKDPFMDAKVNVAPQRRAETVSIPSATSQAAKTKTRTSSRPAPSSTPKKSVPIVTEAPPPLTTTATTTTTTKSRTTFPTASEKEQPLASRKSTGRRKLFSTFIRGRR